MTTIIVKNADFSADRIQHYVPPVEGAVLCAFVGDENADTMLRNFGTAADLQINTGHPAYQGGGFRRFNSGNSLLSPVHYTPQQTILVVSRAVYVDGETPKSFSVAISSERNTETGRAGGGVMRNANADHMAAIYYRDNNPGHTTLIARPFVNQTEATSAGFVAATVDFDGDSLRLAIDRITDPVASSSAVMTGDAEYGPQLDEADYPYLIGVTYRGNPEFSPLDIGFVAVYPRILTAAEIASIHQSVKKRFDSLGVTI